MNFNLASDESIIIKEINVADGGLISPYTDELILTNRNIIHIDKGVFGNIKTVHYYPLKDIKKYNNNAQVILTKLSNGEHIMEIYFQNELLKFRFQYNNKKTIKKWINMINETLGFQPLETEDGINVAINEVGKQFNSVSDSIRKVFLSKNSINHNEVDKECSIINGKCISCSAPLTGKKGTTIKCRYCDTKQILK